ncbi:acetate kinase [Ligilactobacillus sp. WILCCON 0076]|uniref:Acetate kinase n=1 Tax=Ligilactobacillus ubinensis TaxID=2876789 RepID=A0A9X2JLL1_9LACO|nr:acetate kinase [Ligilactobacillus ubinensis]MCP0886710.1 acetate kinase [Ligilactobacillus ubinensis]
MPKILLMNAGSSSVKWKLFEIENEKIVAKGLVERMLMPESTFEISYNDQKYSKIIDNLTYEDAAQMIIEKIQTLNITTLDDIKAVGHRVVAGGQKFKQATLITRENLKNIEDLSDHAPLHNPMEAKYIELMQTVMPQTPQYAVFDSQFFTDMPEVNAIFSLPYEYTEKFGIRRYGEHGISHAYISKQAAKLLGKDLNKLKMVTLHLGSGSSISAEKDGKAFDSSMGFTPLTGVTMGTRSGDIDPSLVPFLMKKLGKSASEIIEIFNTKSGLLGISGVSSDMRDIIKNRAKDKRCGLAVDVFVNRIVKYVGSYFAELGGLDVIVFSGGIGENNSNIRAEIAHKLACLGVLLDEKRNANTKEGVISQEASPITAVVVPTNEELAMIQQIKEII